MTDRVAFLVDRFPKFSETFILNQIVGLVKAGVQVDVFATEEWSTTVTHDEFEAYNLREKASYRAPPDGYLGALQEIVLAIQQDTSAWGPILSAIRRGKLGAGRLTSINQMFSSGKIDEYDAFHAHFRYIGMNWDWLGVYSEKPFVISYYNNNPKWDAGSDIDLERTLFSNADVITGLGDDMLARLENRGADAKKLARHPIVVDVNKFQWTPPQRTSTPTFLTVGRLSEKKGIQDSIRALQRAATEVEFDYQYHIVGDGPLREEIRSVIEDLNLTEQVHLHGYQPLDKVREFYSKSDIFLLASKTASNGDQEGTPTVLVEAQASGLPVISTYHAGIPDIVKDGESGILAPEGEIEQLAAAISWMATNPSYWDRFAESGLTFVESEHSIAAGVDRLTSFYNISP